MRHFWSRIWWKLRFFWLRIRLWFKVFVYSQKLRRGKIIPTFRGFRLEPDMPDMPGRYPCRQCRASSHRVIREKIGAIYQCRTHGTFLVLHPAAMRRGFRYITTAELKAQKIKRRQEQRLLKQEILKQMPVPITGE